jgi:putative hydrolase of the HAD superfamily
MILDELRREPAPLEGLRVVFLDGLGTLVALEPPGPALERRLRSEHGVRLAPGDAERALRAEMAYYRAHHCEGRDAPALEDLRRRCAEVLREELPPAARALSLAELTAALLGSLCFSAYPDARATLAALRARGLALLVVSNWDVSLPAVLRATGLRELLDGVLTSAAVGAPKPQPAIFRAALALAGAAPEQAVHVGDSPVHDVAGALGAGIAPVLLHRKAGPGSTDRSGGTGRTADPGWADGSDGTSVPGELPPGVPVIASLTELLA